MIFQKQANQCDSNKTSKESLISLNIPSIIGEKFQSYSNFDNNFFNFAILIIFNNLKKWNNMTPSGISFSK